MSNITEERKSAGSGGVEDKVFDAVFRGIDDRCLDAKSKSSKICARSILSKPLTATNTTDL